MECHFHTNLASLSPRSYSWRKLNKSYFVNKFFPLLKATPKKKPTTATAAKSRRDEHVYALMQNY